PTVMSAASPVSLLLGFLLVVETMPNVAVRSTGRVSQKDFLWPGMWATPANVVIMTLVAYTYWDGPVSGRRNMKILEGAYEKHKTCRNTRGWNRKGSGARFPESAGYDR